MNTTKITKEDSEFVKSLLRALSKDADTALAFASNLASLYQFRTTPGFEQDFDIALQETVESVLEAHDLWWDEEGHLLDADAGQGPHHE